MIVWWWIWWWGAGGMSLIKLFYYYFFLFYLQMKLMQPLKIKKDNQLVSVKLILSHKTTSTAVPTKNSCVVRYISRCKKWTLSTCFDEKNWASSQTIALLVAGQRGNSRLEIWITNAQGIPSTWLLTPRTGWKTEIGSLLREGIFHSNLGKQLHKQTCF